MKKLDNVHAGGVYCIVVYEDSVVTAGYDRNIYVWDVSGEDVNGLSPSPRLVLKGHTHIIPKNCLAVCGGNIFSGSWDRSIKVWNLKSGDLVRTLTAHKNRIKCIEAPSSPSSSSSSSSTAIPIMLSSGEDFEIIVWNLNDYSPLQAIRLNTTVVDMAITAPIEASESQLVAWLDSNKTITILPINPHKPEDNDLSIGREQPLQLSRCKNFDHITTDSGAITCICFCFASTDGNQHHEQAMLLCGTSEGNILLVNTSSGEVVKCYRDHNDTVASIRVFGSFLFSCDLSGCAMIWHLNSVEGYQVSTPACCTLLTLENVRLFSCSVDVTSMKIIDDAVQSSSSPPVLLAVAGDDGLVSFTLLELNAEMTESNLSATPQKKEKPNSTKNKKIRRFIRLDRSVPSNNDEYGKYPRERTISKFSYENYTLTKEQNTEKREGSPANASIVSVESRNTKFSFEPSLEDSYVFSPPPFPSDDDDESINSIVSEIQRSTTKYLPRISLDIKAIHKHLDSCNEDKRHPLLQGVKGGNHQHVLAMQKHLPSLYSSTKPLMRYNRREDVLQRSQSKSNFKSPSLKSIPPSLSSSALHLGRPVHITNITTAQMGARKKGRKRDSKM